MINTAVYVRVSTDEQAREGFSIRAQEEKLRAYATLKDWNIYSVYADEGISGKDIDGRPAIKQLIADVTSGKVKNVLVYKIDRLTRSTKNLIELVEIFNVNRCAFNSLQESIDTSSATGRMFLKIVGIFAEFERENLAERVRLGIERKAKEGYALNSCVATFGYNRESGNRIQEVNEAEAVTVRRIFDLYLQESKNFSQISIMLNAENIPTKRGKKWSINAVREVLTNPNHVGKVRYAVRDSTRYFEAEGHHEAIIDTATYYHVQERITKTAKISPTKHPTSGVYFCGVLYCQICGEKYTTSWNYRKKKSDGEGERGAAYPAYLCMGVKPRCCTARSISHPKMEYAFEQYISNIEDFAAHGKTEAESPQVNHSADIAAIVAEIKQIEQKTTEVMTLFMSNSIDFTTYQGMVKVGNERRVELEARQALLQTAQTAKEVVYTASDIIASFRENWTVLDNAQRQQFIHKFIKKVVIHRAAPSGEKKLGAIVIDEIIFNEF
ncbi:MAG: recombinase family protein [Defluviitaleaceae bacterium]|nr:recombinase family protein [Defluviitaleaceae bacterium]MCL2262067.1 recombinase family protein [Defluviitaleaceae bacterium]